MVRVFALWLLVVSLALALPGLVAGGEGVGDLVKDLKNKDELVRLKAAKALGKPEKKIRGKFHTFGTWSDPDVAFKRSLDQESGLHADRKPLPERDGLTVKELVNCLSILTWRIKG
jgi:hypothetical protein